MNCLKKSDGTNTSYFIDGNGVDSHLGMRKGGSDYYYYSDFLGSVRNITDSTGSMVNEYSYSSWGEDVSSETISQPYGYTGREFTNTGLMYYRARFYAPNIGQFMSRDPIGLRGGNNLFAYAGNLPVKKSDPFGLRAKTNTNPGWNSSWLNRLYIDMDIWEDTHCQDCIATVCIYVYATGAPPTTKDTSTLDLFIASGVNIISVEWEYILGTLNANCTTLVPATGKGERAKPIGGPDITFAKTVKGEKDDCCEGCKE